MADDRDTSGGPTPDLQLSCQPGKIGGVLIFPYTLRNLGAVEIYAMDALPSLDPASGGARPDDQAAVVILGADGDAIVGKFAAPLPIDRRIAVPVLPLARLLPAGASLEGRLEIPLPLAETSPYFADLTLREYQVADIKGVVFTIGYWAARPGLSAVAAEYAPELLVMTMRSALGSARRVSRRFPTTGLQLFKRTDAFPRTLG